MLKRLLVVVVILFLALAALAEFVLPDVIARGVEKALSTSFGETGEHEVTLKAFPSFRMILGHFDQVKVVSTNVETSTITLSEIAVTLDDASVDMKALLSEKELVVARSSAGQVDLTISTANLADYLAENVPELRDPAVMITPDEAIIAGHLTVVGQDLALAITGVFRLTDDTTVTLDITGFTVNDVPVPGDFLATWLDLVNKPDLSFDLTAFPLPLKGQAVIQEDGRLIIKAIAEQG